MQTKSNDMPKIIGLSVAIVLCLIVALWRIIPALQPPDASTAKPTEPNGMAGQPPVAMPAGLTTPAANPGQMRRFDDTMDADAPVGAGATFGGHGDAFRPIRPPVLVAAVSKPVTMSLPTARPRSDGPILTREGPQVEYVAAPPLEVTLDGVYAVGQERVAQLTIHDTSLKSSPEQTVYRRAGEAVGLFKIARLTDNGVWLRGQNRFWNVGETERLSQGVIPILRTTSPVRTNGGPAKPETLPVMPPR